MSSHRSLQMSSSYFYSTGVFFGVPLFYPLPVAHLSDLQGLDPVPLESIICFKVFQDGKVLHLLMQLQDEGLVHVLLGQKVFRSFYEAFCPCHCCGSN